MKKICSLKFVMIGFFIGLGALLMSLTLYFRVNPVEGSVVDERVMGSLFHYVLLATTMPAWIAGALIAGAVWPLAVVLMYIIQAVLYAMLGWIFFLACRTVTNLLQRRFTYEDFKNRLS